MWLGTFVALTAAAGQGRIGGLAVDPSDPTYEEAVDELVLGGVVVEPALPFGLATVVLNGGVEWTDASSLVATVDASDDGVPSLSTLEIETAGEFGNDGDVDGRDFLHWQRGGSPKADVDGRDFLIWQRGLPVKGGIRGDDLALWTQVYGQTSASTKLPAVDEDVLLVPPKGEELFGFEVQQDGKVRGALLWEVQDLPKGGTDIVSHLWTTAAFEPLLDEADTVTLIPVGTWPSIPEFHDDVVLTLEADPIATYEQHIEHVEATIKVLN
jgi:hypothetical protein